MKKLFLIFISLNLLANNIINYNVYKRDDRLDLMLSFDSPYKAREGDIRILSGSDYVGVVLSDVKIAEKNSLILNMPYVEQLLMYPYEDSTVLEFKTKQKIDVIPAVTKDDGFGLRIRVMPKKSPNEVTKIEYAEDKELFSPTYFAVLGILLILLLVLLYVKRQVSKKAKMPTNNLKTTKEAASFLNVNANKVNIICERQLDKDNRFMVIEYENAKYKLIIGNTNIWLDMPTQDEENFEEYFEENKQKLQNMIKQNALSTYRDKISKI